MNQLIKAPPDASPEDLISEIDDAVNQITIDVINGSNETLYEAFYRCTFYPELLLSEVFLNTLSSKLGELATLTSTLETAQERHTAELLMIECNRVITLCRELQANCEISEMTISVYIKFIRDWMDKGENLYQIAEKFRSNN